LTIYRKKMVGGIPVPRRDVTYQTLPGLAKIIKLFPPRESLVCDIPAEDGNVTNLFYSVVLSRTLKKVSILFLVLV
jgi:hypothetical protein